MKSLLTSLSLALGAAFLLVPAVVVAQDAPAEKRSPEELVEGMDAADFGDRQEASRRLAELGKAALPALEKGVEHSSREVVFRSLDLIRRLHSTGDQEAKAAATEALQRLAKSENESLARRAKEILETKKDPNVVTPNAVPGPFGVPRVARVGVIGGGVIGAGARRVSIKNVNGVRDIEAVEEARKVKIHDDPDKGIEVEITQKKDDKEETKKYEAKNADELKTKHPEAHEAYEKYGKQAELKIEFGGGIAVPVPGGPVPGGPVPAVPVPGLPIPAAPMPADPAALRKLQIESLDRTIQAIDRSLERMQEQKKQMQEKKAALEAEEGKK